MDTNPSPGPVSNNRNPQFEQKVSHIPPPPTDITIRTMASDLESMARSGGNQPQAMQVTMTQSEAPSSSNMILYMAAGVLTVAVIGVVIFILTRR